MELDFFRKIRFDSGEAARLFDPFRLSASAYEIGKPRVASSIAGARN